MAKPSEKITPENYLETNLRLMIWTGLNRPLNTRGVISALFVIRSFYILGTFVLLNLGCFAHIKIVNNNGLLASSVNVLQIIIYMEGMLHVLYHGIRNKALHCLIANVRKSFTFSSNTGETLPCYFNSPVMEKCSCSTFHRAFHNARTNPCCSTEIYHMDIVVCLGCYLLVCYGSSSRRRSSSRLGSSGSRKITLH